jgi:hypothetical protein
VTRIALPLVAPAAVATPLAWPARGALPAFEHAAMHVEKSDVDRMTLARHERGRRRARRLWWAAGLATTAIAGAAVLGPAWLASRDEPSTVAPPRPGDAATARATTSGAHAPLLPSAPATASPGPAPSPSSSTVPVIAASSAAPRAVAVAAAPPQPTASEVAPLASPPASAPPVAPRLAAAHARPPSPALGARATVVAAARPGAATVGRPVPRAVAAAPIPPPARAMAFPSRETNLALARARAARAPLQAQTQAVTARSAAPALAVAPTQARTPATAPAGDKAYPWAVAGKTPANGTSPPLVPIAASGGQPVPPAHGSGPVPPAPAAPNVVAASDGRGADPGTTPLVAATAAGSASSDRRSADGIEVMPDLSARASDLMANHVPRLAQRAERLVARVLFVASRSDDVIGDGAILDSAAALASPAVDPVWGMALSPREARQLNDAARSEYARHGASAQALALQVRAFGADPLDPQIAGDLAFLLLRQRPSQPEAARRLALHALTLHGTGYPQGRIEDWATLAIASALVGRERDASNAFLVSLALTSNLERHCRAALDAYAIYGERLRTPVETMLASISASRRAPQAPSCQSASH